jgi:hypothetical protein
VPAVSTHHAAAVYISAHWQARARAFCGVRDRGRVGTRYGRVAATEALAIRGAESGAELMDSAWPLVRGVEGSGASRRGCPPQYEARASMQVHEGFLEIKNVPITVSACYMYYFFQFIVSGWSTRSSTSLAERHSITVQVFLPSTRAKRTYDTWESAGAGERGALLCNTHVHMALPLPLLLSPLPASNISTTIPYPLDNT